MIYIIISEKIRMADSGKGLLKKKKWGGKERSNAVQRTWSALIQLHCLHLVEGSSLHIPHWHGSSEQKGPRKVYMMCQCVSIWSDMADKREA